MSETNAEYVIVVIVLLSSYFCLNKSKVSQAVEVAHLHKMDELRSDFSDRPVKKVEEESILVFLSLSVSETADWKHVLPIEASQGSFTSIHTLVRF